MFSNNKPKGDPVKKIPGTTIAVFYNGNGLTVENDGYLGRLEHGVITLSLSTDEPKIYGLSVDGQKNVRLKKDRANTLDLAYQRKTYEIIIPIQKTKTGIPRPRPDQNSMVILDLDLLFGGQFQMWEL